MPPLPIYSNLFAVVNAPEAFQVQFKNQLTAKSPIDDVAHVVMSPHNARLLGELLVRVADEMELGKPAKQAH